MKICIYKQERRLELWDGETLVLRAPVQLGFGAEKGHKQIEGDGCTPEGKYYVCSKNPLSKFHCSIGISYPSPEDSLAALNANIITRGEYSAICQAWEQQERPPWDTPLGGWVMVHGMPTDGTPRYGDWTAGCVAISDAAMDVIYNKIKLKDSVFIFE